MSRTRSAMLARHVVGTRRSQPVPTAEHPKQTESHGFGVHVIHPHIILRVVDVSGRHQPTTKPAAAINSNVCA